MEASNPVTITTQAYFEGPPLILGWMLAIVGIPVLVISLMAGIVCLILGYVIISSKYRLRIDSKNKTIHDFLDILWIEKGKKSDYEFLDSVFLKANNYTQTFGLRAATSHIPMTLFSGYLIVDDHKYFLGSDKDYEKAWKKMKAIAEQLQLEFRDLTLGA